MRIDLHVHTSLSPCSQLELADILGRARSLGLDGVCLTDHYPARAGRLIREGVQADGLVVLAGQEYATAEGDFLLFGPQNQPPPDLEARDLLAWVRAAGGEAVIAHPFRQARPAAEGLVRDGSCRLVEGLNGRNQPRENDLVRAWRRFYPLREVGGSDAHSLEELGRVTTVFQDRIASPQDLIAALRGGRYWPEINPIALASARLAA